MSSSFLSSGSGFFDSGSSNTCYFICLVFFLTKIPWYTLAGGNNFDYLWVLFPRAIVPILFNLAHTVGQSISRRSDTHLVRALADLVKTYPTMHLSGSVSWWSISERTRILLLVIKKFMLHGLSKISKQFSTL